MNTALKMDPVFTPEEVAKSLKVTGGTVRNLIKKGRLFAYQVGDQYRIPQYALDQWLSPFAGVNWESMGSGMWKNDKETKNPEKYVQKLRGTKHRTVKDYLADLDADPSS